MNTLLKPLKVVAFSGSPRARGNTYQLIQKMFQVFKKNNVETELVQVGTKPVKGCRGCSKCVDLDHKCVMDDDLVNSSIQKIKEADGMILASPVYCAGPTGQMKCFMDRVSFVNAMARFANGTQGFLYHKVGAGISVHRRGGAVNTQSQLNYFFTISECLIPGSTYWNFAVGMDPGDIKNDEEGIGNMVDLANQMTYLMKLVRQDREKFEK